MMLSIAQARDIATKEWEENYPDEHERLEKLKREGRALSEAALASLDAVVKTHEEDKDQKSSSIYRDVTGMRRMIGINVSTAMMLSGWSKGEKEQKEKDQLIKFRTEQLVKDSMKS